MSEQAHGVGHAGQGVAAFDNIALARRVAQTQPVAGGRRAAKAVTVVADNASKVVARKRVSGVQRCVR